MVVVEGKKRGEGDDECGREQGLRGAADTKRVCRNPACTPCDASTTPMHVALTPCKSNQDGGRGCGGPQLLCGGPGLGPQGERLRPMATHKKSRMWVLSHEVRAGLRPARFSLSYHELGYI